MTYVITQPCVDEMNQDCVDVCPVACIYFDSEDEDRMLYINPDECIECAACESACPVTAIFQVDDVPAEWSEYTELNRLWFEDKEAVRERINELEPAKSHS